MKPIKMRKAMRRVIAYHRRELVAFNKFAFHLDHKLENLATLQFKFYAKTIVIVQITMKFHLTQFVI